MEYLGRDPVHISGLWGRRACLAAVLSKLLPFLLWGSPGPTPPWNLCPLLSPNSEVDSSSKSSQISQLEALPDRRLLFSSRRSDGQNQRFPQALDLPRVDLVSPHAASLYPKVSAPSPLPWSGGPPG